MRASPSNTTALNVSLSILALAALVVGLRHAQGFVAPVVLGLVLGVVIAPLARKLDRFGVPRALSAAAALVSAGFTTLLVLALSGPILAAFAAELPRIEREVTEWLRSLVMVLRSFGGVPSELETQNANGGEDAVAEAMPLLMDALWMAPNFAAQLLIFGGTLFFFVLTRDEIYEAFPKHITNLRAADRAVSFYFTTITLINLGLGLALFTVLTLIGMPNAVLWGTAAFILNFVLYLGPITLIVALSVGGLVAFDGAYAFVPPLAFFTLNVIEAQFVTPTLVGRRLNINPLAVFLSIVFGLWLWGPMGGIVALPVLVWLFAARQAALQRGRISEYLGADQAA